MPQPYLYHKVTVAEMLRVPLALGPDVAGLSRVYVKDGGMYLDAYKETYKLLSGLPEDFYGSWYVDGDSGYDFYGLLSLWTDADEFQMEDDEILFEAEGQGMLRVTYIYTGGENCVWEGTDCFKSNAHEFPEDSPHNFSSEDLPRFEKTFPSRNEFLLWWESLLSTMGAESLDVQVQGVGDDYFGFFSTDYRNCAGTVLGQYTNDISTQFVVVYESVLYALQNLRFMEESEYTVGIYIEPANSSDLYKATFVRIGWGEVFVELMFSIETLWLNAYGKIQEAAGSSGTFRVIQAYATNDRKDPALLVYDVGNQGMFVDNVLSEIPEKDVLVFRPKLRIGRKKAIESPGISLKKLNAPPAVRIFASLNIHTLPNKTVPSFRYHTLYMCDRYLLFEGGDPSHGWTSVYVTSYVGPTKERHSTPEHIWQVEYPAQFAENSGQVFRGIQQAATAPTDSQPIDGRRYVAGVGWGRDGDYTVIAIMDAESRDLVALDRFNQVSWALQRGRLVALCERWRPAVIWAEENSIGSPNIEALQAEGLPIRPFSTTAKSKPPLIEGLALALERGEIQLLPDETLLGELAAYEMTRQGDGYRRYSAPSGGHDDCVIALALAWYGMKQGGTRIDFV